APGWPRSPARSSGGYACSCRLGLWRRPGTGRKRLSRTGKRENGWEEPGPDHQTWAVLLTIKTRMSPATDLGHLLHKHPDRVQRFEQAFGTAHVFYPDAGERECTAALLLDVDPVKLVRTRGRGTPDRAAIGAAGLWDELDTGWLAVDGELMPWSAKAMELIRTQYAATGAAAAPPCPRRPPSSPARASAASTSGTSASASTGAPPTRPASGAPTRATAGRWRD